MLYRSIVFSLFIILCSCVNTNTKKVFDFGKVTNNTYSNDYFEFSIQFPKKWDLKSKKEIEKLSKTSKETVSKDLKEIVELSEINSVNLLFAFQYPDSIKVKYNANIIIVAENISSFENIKNSRDYLNQTKIMMQNSGLDYVFLEKIKKEIFGSKTFSSMTAITNTTGVKMYQKYLNYIKDNFSITIIASYSDRYQKEAIENILNTYDEY